MANTNAPFGFRPVRRLDGSAFTGAQSVKKVAAADATAIYKGDPVRQLATGYINRGAAGITTHVLTGIFVGCRYVLAATGSRWYSPYWPGSGAQGSDDIEAFCIDDPGVVFEAQSSGAAITKADVGANIDVALGTGNPLNGQSGATVDQATLATTATLPFRIVALSPGVGDGYDHASSFNRVLVAWNDQFLRQMTGV